MSNRIKNNLKNLVGQTLNQYYSKVKPTISDLRYKQEYQNRIIECMVGEVDDNYITTPETDNPIVKLEHSKEGLVKVPTVKGKTILVDADGNETDTPAEGCRLVSVGEQEDNKLIILSKNKNLFKGKLELGNINEYGVSISNESRVRSIDFTEINQNTQLVFSTPQSLAKYFVYYNEKKECIIRVYSSASKKNILNIPNGAKYLKVCLVNCTDVNTQVQLEIGDTETFYVEPKQHKTEILLDKPLKRLEVLQDEIIDNNIIYRVGSVVFDGNDNEIWHKVNNDKFVNTTLFKIYNVMPLRWHSRKKISNSLVSTSGDYFNDKQSFCNEDSSGTLCLKINKSNLVTDDVEGLRKWLKENPITILYELEEPTIEELPNSITTQGFDDTTIYIENSITPTVSYGYNALIPYKEELSNQKEEVEINTLDIENNIIPYLLDMEFNLMTMEDK